MCIKKVSSINLKSKTKGWFLLVWVFLSDKSINYLKLLKALYSCLESVNCLVYCSHTSMFGAYINHVTQVIQPTSVQTFFTSNIGTCIKLHPILLKLFLK